VIGERHRPVGIHIPILPKVMVTILAQESLNSDQSVIAVESKLFTNGQKANLSCYCSYRRILIVRGQARSGLPH